MSAEIRKLLVEKQQAIIARKLELDPPPAESGTSEAEAEAAAARSARWREADAKYREKRRELERDLGRADPTLAPGRREALERHRPA